MTADDLLALLTPFAPQRALTAPDSLLLLLLAGTCAVIVAVDARARIIPDGCNLLVAALGLGFAGRDGGWPALAALLQGLGSFVVFWLFRAGYRGLRGRHGLGLGDVKFLGAAGTWVGLAGVPPLVLAACAAALAYLGVEHLRGHAVSGQRAIPFGPFLVFGFLCVLGSGLV